MAMLPDGKIIDYSVTMPAEQATPEIIYKVLVTGLGQGARQGRFRAVGICHGVAMKDTGRAALRILLEQPGGVAREVLRPFEKRAGSTAPSLLKETVTATSAVIYFDDQM
jgi:hypothetical protein